MGVVSAKTLGGEGEGAQTAFRDDAVGHVDNMQPYGQISWLNNSANQQSESHSLYY